MLLQYGEPRGNALYLMESANGRHLLAWDCRDEIKIESPVGTAHVFPKTDLDKWITEFFMSFTDEFFDGQKKGKSPMLDWHTFHFATYSVWKCTCKNTWRQLCSCLSFDSAVISCWSQNDRVHQGKYNVLIINHTLFYLLWPGPFLFESSKLHF